MKAKPPVLSAADRAKGIEARRAATRDNPYKTDWLDADLWLQLAKNAGMKLPQWYIPPTPRRLKTAFGITCPGADFKDVYGCSPRRLIELNPKMPLRAFVGQMLERTRGKTLSSTSTKEAS